MSRMILYDYPELSDKITIYDNIVIILFELVPRPKIFIKYMIFY